MLFFNISTSGSKTLCADKCSVYLNGHQIRFHNDNIQIFSIPADFVSVLYQEGHSHISHYGSGMSVSPAVLLTIVSKLYY